MSKYNHPYCFRISMNFGANLRYYRKQKKITQENLAKHIAQYTSDNNYTFQQIQKYEWGVSNPNIILAKLIAECLGIEIQQLFEPRKNIKHILSAQIYEKEPINVSHQITYVQKG